MVLEIIHGEYITTRHTPADANVQVLESRYAIGWEPPNYPVPAKASSSMRCALIWVPPMHGHQLAWDHVWQDESEFYVFWQDESEFYV